jgi:hypothetical protein
VTIGCAVGSNGFQSWTGRDTLVSASSSILA